MNADLRTKLIRTGEFDAVGAEDLDALVEEFCVEAIGGGRELVEAGSLDDSLWFVVDGELVTLRGDRELGVLLPGEWIGALAQASCSRHDVTVRTVTPCRIARLTSAARTALEADHPQLRVPLQQALGRQIARELRQTQRRIRGHLASLDQTMAPNEFDVAVIGAGPIGLAYAIWLKRARPGTRVVVMDRRHRPGYKVGESTLSTTVRCLRSLGLSHTMLRRLFANKLGIAFWWAGPDRPKPSKHIDVIEIEETFQVERNVLETALLECAARLGIDVRADCRVDMTRSTIETPRSRLLCSTPEGDQVLTASVVCDASGNAAVVPRALGLYRKPTDTIDTNAYFGYFRRKSHADLPHWDVAATRHLCFPQGWWWFITVCSWEGTPDDALERMVKAMLNELPIDDGDHVPTRKEFATRFGAQTEEIVSIGVVVRDDQDDSKHLRPEERFDHWVKRYPAVADVLQHYEWVERPYQRNRPIWALQKIVHDVEAAAGDGWLAIGDAAFFVNPLFSPGMNFGSGTAYMGVQATIRALDTANASSATFATYDRYCHDIGTALFRENEMLYRSFRSERSYERALMLKFFFGITDILPRDTYTPSDPYVYNLIDPRFTSTVNELVQLMRDGEERQEPPDITAEQVAAVVDDLADWLRKQDVVREAGVGKYFTHYTDDLYRVDERTRGRGDFRTWRCTECRSYVEETFRRCLVCGAAAPRAVTSASP
jgi:flavin-dependent dehydrogenase